MGTKITQSGKKAKKSRQLRNDLQKRQFGFDLGIYDPSAKCVYMLNPVAAIIIENLTNGKTENEIVENIGIVLNIGQEPAVNIIKDIKRTIGEFERLNLLVEVDESKLLDTDKTVSITEFHITQMPISYFRPKIAIHTLEDLQAQYIGPSKTDFGDDWNPGT